MSNVLEFLEARIEEDEQAANGTQPANEKLLAECRSKRRILTRGAAFRTEYESHGDSLTIAGIMAGAYSDHPDFREEWNTPTR